MDKLIKYVRLILILFFLFWAIVWYSIRAYKLSENEDKEMGFINSLLTELYHTPYLIKKYFRKEFQVVEINEGDSLIELGKLSALNNINDSIYILHSKFINKSKTSVVLQNVKTGKIDFTWNIPLDIIINDLDSLRNDLKIKSLKGRVPKKLTTLISKNTSSIVIRHPIFLKDSSLIFKAQYLGLLYKVDKNSKLLWKSKRLVHHSIELDENENIWVCSVDLDNKLANKLDFRDDAILCLDQEGNEKYFMSLTDIFQNNNLFEYLIEATPIVNSEVGRDPYHLNDIQPVKTNGTYWGKGDVFFSLRHKSVVALFRPNSGKIMWIQQGPWYKQHDINIENDSVISLFNNNASFINNKINSSSNLAKYNFANNEVYFFANDLFRSKTEGRQSSLSNGDIVVESTNEGIYYILDSIGNLKSKFYVAYEPDSKYAQYPGWSRIYLKENNNFIEQ